ncbi:MAG: ParB/RepB/Spo0J family partition protein [Nitrospirae bacterium]|nr:ParB/RepB/Spo0J family partition protein [Nitrospirota bacterium]
MKKKALGRGLETLIPEKSTPAEPSDRVFQVEIDRIRPNRYQPRQVFTEEGISELADSIKIHGVIQPVILRSLKQGGYELIAGERRFRAVHFLGLRTIPALIREATDERSLELALIENIQREDLNPLEAAEAYQRLMDDFGLTQEEIAKRVGKDRATVTNTLRILSLPKEVKDSISAGILTLGHAKAILALARKEDQIEMASRILREGLSVRAVESLAQKGVRKRHAAIPPPRHPQIREIEERLQRALGTRVRVQGKGKRGKIVVEYFGAEDLTRIMEIVGA